MRISMLTQRSYHFGVNADFIADFHQFGSVDKLKLSSDREATCIRFKTKKHFKTVDPVVQQQIPDTVYFRESVEITRGLGERINNFLRIIHRSLIN